MNSLVLRLATAIFALLCVPALSCPAEAADYKSFIDIKLTPDRDKDSEARGELRADARELARLLNIEPYVNRLRELKEQKRSDNAPLSRRDQSVRLLCLWKLMTASEEVRAVTAKLNSELDSTQISLDSLTARQSMTSNVLNAFNFLQGGVQGVVQNAVDFNYGSNRANSNLYITTGGATIGLATLGLFVPSLWSRPIDSPPNMLAHFFDNNFRAHDADRSYLWKFMTSPIPGSSQSFTRRDILLKHWEEYAAVDSLDKKLVARLAAHAPESQTLRETISILSQRIFLLHDLKTHFEEFDGSLYELHKAISLD